MAPECTTCSWPKELSSFGNYLTDKIESGLKNISNGAESVGNVIVDTFKPKGGGPIWGNDPSGDTGRSGKPTMQPIDSNDLPTPGNSSNYTKAKLLNVVSDIMEGIRIGSDIVESLGLDGVLETSKRDDYPVTSDKSKKSDPFIIIQYSSNSGNDNVVWKTSAPNLEEAKKDTTERMQSTTPKQRRYSNTYGVDSLRIEENKSK